ncbi:MAG: hypothetical protein AB7F76_10780 [Parvibaculaceae bacterium]|jgi:hypothetical protein
MDWDRAIERNSEALRVIVAALIAMLGLAGGGTVARLPRELHRAVLRVLRPAESAVRRLIVIAARDLEAKPAPARLKPQGLIPHGAGHRRSFQLFDRRKRFVIGRKPSGSPSLPRIHIFGSDPRVMVRPPAPLALPAPPDDGRIDGRRLALRLAALKSALDDLPRQARRLVRTRTKREQRRDALFTSPLRPGRPPGYRRVPLHDVDRVLAECHGLAVSAMQSDTS